MRYVHRVPIRKEDVQEALIPAIVARGPPQCFDDAREHLCGRLDDHQSAVEAIGEKEIWRRGDGRTLEEVVDVLERDHVGIEKHDLVEVDELPSPKLRKHSAKPFEETSGLGIGIFERLDVPYLPALPR